MGSFVPRLLASRCTVLSGIASLHIAQLLLLHPAVSKSYGPDHAKVANVMLSLAKAKEQLLGDKGMAADSRKASLDYRVQELDVRYKFDFLLHETTLVLITPFETQSAKDLAKGALEIYRAEFKDIEGGAETHKQTMDAARETKRIENMIEKAKSKS